VPHTQNENTLAELSFVRGLPLTRAAILYARDRHGSQRRDGDGAPFLLHPLEAAAMLARSRYPDHVIAAAVLHDVLEDTPAERAEVETRFGADVAELVALVSDDPSIADDERQKDDVRDRVARAGGYAAVVYAADKVSKVRELRMLITGGLEAERVEAKVQHYWKSLGMLERKIPDSRIVDVLRFELEVLELLPPERKL
jgi:(p)ppGpp synthase/HD superfamily hydrolase